MAFDLLAICSNHRSIPVDATQPMLQQVAAVVLVVSQLSIQPGQYYKSLHRFGNKHESVLGDVARSPPNTCV